MRRKNSDVVATALCRRLLSKSASTPAFDSFGAAGSETATAANHNRLTDANEGSEGSYVEPKFNVRFLRCLL